jgi:hypothetical protein
MCEGVVAVCVCVIFGRESECERNGVELSSGVMMRGMEELKFGALVNVVQRCRQLQ